MADAPAHLDYAQPLAWRHRRGVRRGIVAGVFLLAVLGSLKFLGAAWNHGRLLYYQGRCMGHVEQGRRVVFDGAGAMGKPDRDWDRFYSLFSPPGGKFTSTVFLGTLAHPDGSRRLVCVDLVIERNLHEPFAPPPAFDYQVIAPGSAMARPRLCSNHWWRVQLGGGGSSLSGSEAISRLYAGTRDPSNESHFTIEFERGGKEGVIDGWLLSDETVLFEERREVKYER